MPTMDIHYLVVVILAAKINFVKTFFDFVCSARLFAKLLRPGDSEVTSSSQAATCYYQSNHSSKVESIPLSALPKDTTSELAGLSPHYSFLMLNAKQESCEYQLI